MSIAPKYLYGDRIWRNSRIIGPITRNKKNEILVSPFTPIFEQSIKRSPPKKKPIKWRNLSLPAAKLGTPGLK